MNIKSISLFLPFIVSAIGGVYFGLFSCGGYVWHKKAFDIIFFVTLIICLLFRYKGIATTRSKMKPIALLIIWVVLIVSCYFVSEAAAAAFYPDSPDSLRDFWYRFMIGLKYGPC